MMRRMSSRNDIDTIQCLSVTDLQESPFHHSEITSNFVKKKRKPGTGKNYCAVKKKILLKRPVGYIL